MNSNEFQMETSKQRTIEAESINDFVYRVTSDSQTDMHNRFEKLRKNERHIFQFMAHPDVCHIFQN